LSFFSQLTEKPWETVPGQAADAGGGSAFAVPTSKLALALFLFVVAILFWLFSLVYFERMEIRDWRPLPEPGLLWFNTGLLILSSFAIQWARTRARKGMLKQTKAALYLAGALTIVFLIGQLIVWQQLVDMGYYLASNPANDFFYLLTGLHGLHMIGGLFAWARTTYKVTYLQEEREQAALSVELCAIYWHFLLVVWFALFILLIYT